MPKITALPAAGAANLTDLLAKVNDPSGTPVTQKVTISQINALLLPNGPAWDTVVTKTLDQDVTNSSALENDNELLTALAVNSFYLVSLIVVYSGTSSAGDYSWLLTHPSIGTNTTIGRVNKIATNLAADISAFSGTGTQWPSATQTAGTDALGSFMTLAIELAIRTGAAAGNLQYQFAQAVATPATVATTRAGSTLRIKLLA